MANYSVDILVALKGAQKLAAFNKTLDATKEISTVVNKNTRLLAKNNKLVIRSFDTLNTALATAKKQFNEVASGTSLQTRAAKELVVAERQLNKEYQLREQLLNKLRQASPFAQFSRSASQVSGPTVFDTTTQKSIDRNRRNRDRIAGRSPVPYGPQQFIGPLPMQGPMYGPMQGPNPMLTVDNNPRILRNLAASQVSREASAFKIRPGTGYDRPIGPAFSAVMKSQLRHQKKIDKNTGKTAQLLSASNNRAVFSDISGQTQYSTPIGPSRAGLFSRLGFGRNAQGGPFAFPGGRMARIKGGMGSAMIGGGFPLLFGAGGLSAAMGGVAGGIGGALAPGGGFAASIAATAAASEIEKTIVFRKEIKKLNEEVKLSGASTEFTRQAIKKLAKDLDITKEEAIELANQFSEFGGETGDALIRAFSSREIFNSLSGLRTTESVLSKISELRKTIGENSRAEALQILATKGSLEAQLFLEERILNRNREQVELNARKITGQDRRYFMSMGYTSIDMKKFIEQRVQKELEAFDKLNDKQLSVLKNQIKINEQMQFITEFQAPTDQLREMLNPLRQILDLSNAIRDGFEDSFKGLIRGTMSVADAFRSMFNRIADHFIDMAARTAAVQLQQGFLSLFSSMFNFGANKFVGGSDYWDSKTGKGIRGPNYGLADGGTARSGQSYLVGERGPEIFTPKNTGTVIPNHELGGLGGSSTNISVNIDASGTSVQGSESNGEELGRLVAAAIQSELIKEKRPGGLLS